MSRLSFPTTINKDKSGFYLVKFLDVPCAATDGRTIPEALSEAVDCLDEALAAIIKHGEPVPEPSGKTLHMVSPSALIAAKTALYIAWKESRLSCNALSKRLGIGLILLQRMLDPKHRTHIGSIEAVLKSLGSRLIVDFAKAA